MNKEELRILDEQVLEKYGAFERVRRWYEGWVEDIPGAVLSNGNLGKRTMVEITIIKPSKIIEVKK